jgi:signal peptidase II
MYLGEEINVVSNWFIIHFTENNGFAFGIEFGGRVGKIILTSFRILAAGLIGYYLVTLLKKDVPKGFLVAVSLIFVGAVGNILDSVFYGLLFHYDSLFYGRVVDMLYFPVINTHYPQWFPWVGGNEFIFFRPVFNISDTAITIGVFSIILFYSRFLKKI